VAAAVHLPDVPQRRPHDRQLRPARKAAAFVTCREVALSRGCTLPLKVKAEAQLRREQRAR